MGDHILVDRLGDCSPDRSPSQLRFRLDSISVVLAERCGFFVPHLPAASEEQQVGHARTKIAR